MAKTIVQRLLAELTAVDFVLWGIAFLLILAGIVWALILEKRTFQARGKGRSGLWLRLLSLPILMLTVIAIIVPARGSPGMEALGIFYLALFLLGPVIWFGLHWLVGVLLSPRLTRSESTTMALTGLALLFVPPIVVSMLQSPVFMISRQLNELMFASARSTPLAHEVQPMQRLRLGNAGEIYTQTLRAPADVRIERIDALLADHWHNTKTMMHSYLCRQGNDLHLAWPAGSVPPPLKLFWRDATNTRQQAEFRVDATGTEKLPVKDFTIGWRDDGIDLPVAISRDSVQLGWADKSNNLHYRSLNPLQPGETFENNCVMAGYRRLAAQEEGPIAAVILRFYPRPPAQLWQHEITRPK